jgi:DNA polymerase-3 subunit epsilon/exodeoxyribonuclease X
MPKYILFDTETTGNSQEDRIIQVGAIILSNSGIDAHYDELCSSDIDIKIEAMEVHGIVPEDILNKPKFIETSFYQELNRLNISENYLIAHNIKFDLGMLEKEGFENHLTLIDTLRCSKHLYPESPFHRLQYFRYSLELYKEEKAKAQKLAIEIKPHDALSDVIIMQLFISHLVKKVKEKFPDKNPMKQLAYLTQTPVMLETFRFGKYKDQKIAKIVNQDKGYISWMLKNMEMDEDLKYTLDTLMGKLL